MGSREQSVRSREQEQALARAALSLMESCGVTPTPESFELFRAYASQDNPALSRVM